MSNDENVLTSVSAEQFAEIRVDLEKLLDVSQKSGEALGAYAERLAKLANDPKKVSDEAWETLSDPTQKWVNGMHQAAEAGKPLPLPPVADTADEDSDDKAPKKSADKKEPKTAAKDKDKAPKKSADKKTPAVAAKEKKKDAPSAKKADKAKPAKVGRKPKFDGAAVVLVEGENPHRKGSKDFDKFKKLKSKSGQTVEKILAAGIEASYLRYAAGRDLIKIKA